MHSMAKAIMRVGMDCVRRPVLAKCQENGWPVIISANSLWRYKTKRFSGYAGYAGHDIALDSGGFVAMKLYGGYRFSERQYAALSGAIKPTWWAQMDLCCEPEIAFDNAAVSQRIEGTAKNLMELNAIANGEGLPAPMPVLQGWKPEDYLRGPIYNQTTWPDLIGIGSVCRRPLHGKTGLLSVLRSIDDATPKNARWHLFGVKSAAIRVLVENFGERILSFDSQAWAMGGRRVCYRKDLPCSNEARASFMSDWMARQIEQQSQLQGKLI